MQGKCGLIHYVKFKCRKCGWPSKLPTTELADYYASENQEWLQCWKCMPIRSKAPARLPAKIEIILISLYSKQVDKWVKCKRKRKVRK